MIWSDHNMIMPVQGSTSGGATLSAGRMRCSRWKLLNLKWLLYEEMLDFGWKTINAARRGEVYPARRVRLLKIEMSHSRSRKWMFLKRKSKILPVKNDASVRLGVTPRAAADHAQVRFSIDVPWFSTVFRWVLASFLTQIHIQTGTVLTSVQVNDEFCVRNDGFCIQKAGFCI